MTSPTFAEQLQTLPPIDHLDALELQDGAGQTVARIENRPGQAGSLRVYAALAAQGGGRIDAAGARLGLQWYAEHTADARAHPGRHPNIDRLQALVDADGVWQVRLVSRPV